MEPLETVRGDALPIEEPTSVLAFSCKCGCDIFRMIVNTYKNGEWTSRMVCVECQSVLQVTEPILNGPH